MPTEVTPGSASGRIEVGQAMQTPWKVWNEVLRWLAYPRIRLLFALNGIRWGEGWRLHGVPIIQKHRGSRMEFGSSLQLRSSARSNPLGANRPVILSTWQAGAVLEIGDHFAMTGGTVCACERITIGQDVTVGANTTIMDSDFHPPDPEQRRLHPHRASTAPVLIQDGVFIGVQCLILKGITLGQGCVVGAGSVVTQDVPAGVFVAGNPAQPIAAPTPYGSGLAETRRG
jgi:acetyltransferase-like isoleucine patch superfamily enzyme